MPQVLTCKDGWLYFANYYGEGPSYICAADRYAVVIDAEAFEITDSVFPTLSIEDAKAIWLPIALIFTAAFIWRKLRDIV